MSEYLMRVVKYIPARLFGFAGGTDIQQDVFFHLGSFQPGSHTHPSLTCPVCKDTKCGEATAPPPILGEQVQVSFDPTTIVSGKAPRATKILRIESPVMVVGRVDSFDAHRGYGFVHGNDGVHYHLHDSEILDGRMPLSGGYVVFFAGQRQGRPRACHIRVCR